MTRIHTLRLILTAGLLALPAWSAQAATFTVINTSNSGDGSLRQAIVDANNAAGDDTIEFAIPGDGPHVIRPLSSLPPITEAVTIDGYSQSGSSENSLDTGTDAVLKIELRGDIAGANGKGLNIVANNCVVQGLVINSFSKQGILVTGSSNWIRGCFIGTDPTGLLDKGNIKQGVYIRTGAGNQIGGDQPGDRNLISGNNDDAVVLAGISGQLSGSNIVQGNLIGTDSAGIARLGNDGAGVSTSGSNLNMIGGTQAGAGNVIADNKEDGVFILTFDSTNAILGNSIFNNGVDDEDIGIDLFNRNFNGGVSLNDSCDGDAVPDANNLQNYPVLTGANSDGASTTVTGSLNSGANTTYRIEFFANEQCDEDSTNHGQGQVFLGAVNRTTDPSCNVALNENLPVAVPGGRYITATASRIVGMNYETSEYSICREVTGPANTAPTAVCQDVVKAAVEHCHAEVTAAEVDNGSSDADGIVRMTLDPPGPYPLGDTPVVLTVTDLWGATGSCEATVTVTGIHADVQVAIVADKPAVKVGKKVIYTITVTNNGPDTANNVTLTDNLPDGVRFIAAESTPGIVKDGLRLTYDVGALDSGNSEVVTVVVKTTTAGRIRNRVSVVADECDSNNANNSATIRTHVEP